MIIFLERNASAKEIVRNQENVCVKRERKMDSICMYCKNWTKDTSHDLDMIAFHNMSGWEDAKSQGWCSIDKIICVYDDTCDKYEEY